MNQATFKSPYYRVLALLLEYPNEHFAELLRETKAFLLTLLDREAPHVARVIEFINRMSEQDLSEIQQAYVQTFDLTARNSLHLTCHALEEQDRRRGPALIKLAQYYAASGMRVAGGELPDYLPAILEYASTLEPRGAAGFLGEAADSLAILQQNLSSDESPYATLLSALNRSIHAQREAAQAFAAGA